MIAQGILPFKLERTDDRLTPRSGLALFAEVVRSLRVDRLVEALFPKPGSNRGYPTWAFVEPVLLMIEGGGRHVEDLREIRDDETLRRLVGLKRMPALSTFGDWLERMGRRGGLEAAVETNERVANRILERQAAADYTLDVDATVIEADKRTAAWTYKKVRGYQPLLGFLAENGVCLAHEFREGNVAAHSRALAFLKRCRRLCLRIRRLRSDSAFYQADVMNWCRETGIGFTITADKDAGVKEVIGTIKDWKKLRGPAGEATDREVGTAIHILQKSEAAIRLVVERWRDPQGELFAPHGYCYYVIATNREELEPEEVVWFHNQRGVVENEIKELKIGFGMEQMTSGDFGANAVWFALGVATSEEKFALLLGVRNRAAAFL